MPTPPLPDEALVQVVEAYIAHGRVAAYAAESLGIPRNTFVHRLQVAKSRPHIRERLMEPVRVTETTGANGEVRGRSVTSTMVGEGWEAPDGWGVSRVSVLTDAEGRERARWTRASPENDAGGRFLEALDAALTSYEPIAPIAPPDDPDGDLLTLMPIPDAHVGQLSWGPETGENYDLRSAERTVLDMASSLVGGTPSSDTAALVFLGDYLHANDPTNTTPASGHSLDVDGRHVKVIDAAIRIALGLVSMAAHRHRRVIVRVLEGNHDPHPAPWLSRVIKHAFAADDRVEVDTSPGLFWFFEWGTTLLCATHGHTCKPRDLPMIAAESVPRMWGRTQYRRGFMGHYHKEAHAPGKMPVRILPAVTARDAYAASRGYFADRGMIALQFHRERGPCGETARYLPAATMETA